MTPQEEIVLATIQKGKVHTISQLLVALNVSNVSNYPHCLQKLARDGLIVKRDCPKCDKEGYYEMC